MTIGERIRKKRIELGMSQEELAKKLNYKSRSSINKIEKDGRELRQNKIVSIAEALQTSPQYIMGWIDDEDDSDKIIHYYDNTLDKVEQLLIPLDVRVSPLYVNKYGTEPAIQLTDCSKNISFVCYEGDLINLYEKMKMDNKEISAEHLYDSIYNAKLPNSEKPLVPTATIPVLGHIPAGVPLDAIEDIQGYIDVPTAWVDDHGALIVIGDSMSPKYLDGDTVIFRIQPDCENGQDCVVYVNGYDATLKKVIKTETGIILQPLNPEFEPIICGPDNPATILGVVVELRRKV